jgi:DNA-binding MarR family transcriptional regulator
MEKKQLVGEVILLQRQVNRLFRDSNSDAWMAMNLTRAQIKSLFYIDREKDANFRKLATALGVSPSNVTGIIDRLVVQGLVTRNDDMGDRRVVFLRTTKKGEALIADLRENRTKQLSAILEHMSSESLSFLINGYSALLKAAEVNKEKKVADGR